MKLKPDNMTHKQWLSYLATKQENDDRLEAKAKTVIRKCTVSNCAGTYTYMNTVCTVCSEDLVYEIF